MLKRCKQILLIMLAAAAVVMIVYSLNSTSSNITQEEKKMLSSRIRQASVLCYALEGFYPEDLSYLEENYGVIVDRSKYHVYYQTIGSNIRPEIEVYAKGEQE